MVFTSAAASAGPREYWVSPSGNDDDPGTKQLPFATLERARSAVREARESGAQPAPTTIWVGGGTYPFDKTFELDARDSGTAESPVVYRALPGQTARLVGGKQIPPEGFQPVSASRAAAWVSASAR